MPERPDFRAQAIEQKIALHQHDEEPMPPQELEAMVDEMIEAYGSAETVCDILKLEELCDRLGISVDDYGQADQGRQAEFLAYFKESFSLTAGAIIQLLGSGKEEAANSAVSQFISNILRENEASFILGLKEFRQYAAKEDFVELLLTRRKVMSTQMADQFQQLLSAIDSPPPPGGEDRAQNPVVKPLKHFYRQAVAVLASAGGGKEPPPPPGIGEVEGEYEEVIPVDLEDVWWNSEQTFGLVFEKVYELTDDQERKRIYNRGYIIDRRDGKNEKIDLSNYIGKKVYFEGTTGLLSAAHNEVLPNGVATDTQVGNDFYPVALNPAWLKKGGMVALGTVFHEMGHCYIFNEKLDQDIFKRPEQESSGAAALLRRVLSKKPSEVKDRFRGVVNYREALKSAFSDIKVEQNDLNDLRQQIHQLSAERQLKGERPRVVEIGSGQLKSYVLSHVTEEESQYLRQITEAETRLKNYFYYANKAGESRPDFHRAIQHSSIHAVTSIMWERNARAFSVRQIRKLIREHNFPEDLDRCILTQQLSSLASPAYGNDPRYTEGITSNQPETS